MPNVNPSFLPHCTSNKSLSVESDLMDFPFACHFDIYLYVYCDYLKLRSGSCFLNFVNETRIFVGKKTLVRLKDGRKGAGWARGWNLQCDGRYPGKSTILVSRALNAWCVF